MPELQEQDKPKGVRVFGPDNRYYRFPEGTTKEKAVAFFKAKGITSAESSAFKPSTTPRPKPQAAAPTPKPAQPTAAEKDPIVQFTKQLQQRRPRWDTPGAILQDPTW